MLARIPYRVVTAAVLTTVLFCDLAACVQNDGTRNPLSGKVSEDGERELGFEFDLEIEKYLDFIDDPLVLGFLNDVGQDLVGQLEPQPFVYRFRLIRDPSLNAFAVPGGYIYLHSGTLLAAGSLDEFVGVLAHEMGHVKGRHYARMHEKALIPGLLAQLAGLAAASVSGEPGLAVAAQGANVAMQLRFTREFEAEADQLAVTFMTRAGYAPEGLARFFERLIAAQEETPLHIPPYLYSHPAVEERIEAVRTAGRQRTQPALPVFAAEFRAIQARLAALVESERSTWVAAPAFDRERSTPQLAAAEALAQQNRRGEAIALLHRTEAEIPGDPRLPYRLAELLTAENRAPEAIAAYRRTLALDPTRALVYFRLGRFYQAQGDRHHATYYFEQAAHRAGPTSPLREQALVRIERTVFSVVTDSGLASGCAAARTDGAAGLSQMEFTAGDSEVLWWAKLGQRFLVERENIEVQWINPQGKLVQKGRAEALRRPYITASLTLTDAARTPGTWRCEARLDGDLINRHTFQID